ncbi:SusE domain-containing protein [Leeuwenhoekiella sp. H156]|uniref:SusE domain-containing protein n=1 Tax=Leeuwenhoekiella sp. H156 TaxID=3450128 RepID=UPI003FA491E6
MITTLKRSLFLLTGLLIASCSEEDEKLSVASEEAPLVANLDINRVALDQTNPGNPAVTVSWSEAVYSMPTPIKYVVQFAANQNFETSVNATTTSLEEATLSMSAVNNAVNDLGFVPFEWQQAYIRVQSSIGTRDSEIQYSEPIGIMVYPYFSYPYDDYYLVGAATAPGWSNDNNNPVLFRDAFNENLYRYTGRFNQDFFKILDQRGSWAPQYGVEGGNLKLRPTEDQPDPPSIESTRAGYRTLTVNLANNTFSFKEVENVPDAFSSVTVTGNTGGNVVLTALAFDPHIWYVRSTPLETGSITFSANGMSYGGATEFSGVAEVDGGSIPVPVKDDYEIWFNDITGEYVMIPLNFSK